MMADPKLDAVLRPDESWRGQRVVVLGLGRSGSAACRLLAHEGARVHAVDDRPAQEHAQLRDALADRVESWTFGHRDAVSLADAEAMVVSPGVAPEHPWLAAAVAREMPVLSELELASRRIDRPILAVTGTNGKSTTVSLVHRLLESAGISARLAGNIGHALADQALDLGDASAVVVEVSSFQLERVSLFHPRVSAVLNVAPDHLDRYPSFEHYAGAKRRILENLGRGDLYVHPADDERLRGWAKDCDASSAPFSTGDPGLSTGAFVRDGRVVLRRADREEEVLAVEEIPLVGEHNLRNVLAALSISLAFDCGVEALRSAVRSFEPLAHRAITVPTADGIRWIDDSKATNVHAALATVGGLSAPVIWLLGGRGKGEDYRALGAAAGPVRRAICFGEEGDPIAAALEGRVEVDRVGGLEAALQRAEEIALEGETVVLSPACASFDEFSSFAARGEFFQDWVRRHRGGAT